MKSSVVGEPLYQRHITESKPTAVAHGRSRPGRWHGHSFTEEAASTDTLHPTRCPLSQHPEKGQWG